MATVTKENITINDFNRVCRTCLSTKELHTIYGVLNSDCTSIQFLLNKYTEIKLDYPDKLPQQICSKCLVNLNSAYIFLNTCDLINKALIECSTRFESTKTSSSCFSHTIELVKCEIKQESQETTYSKDFHNYSRTQHSLEVENINSSIDIKDEPQQQSIEKINIAHNSENEFYSEEDMNLDDPNNENNFDSVIGRMRNRGLRGKWSSKDLKNAVAAIAAGSSHNAASKLFKIPRRTLSRYVDNKQTNKSPMGRKPILNEEQEKVLSGRIVRLAEIGYPLTSDTIRRCVFNYCKENNIENNFSTMSNMAGHCWLYGFLKRNNKIKRCRTQGSNPARAQKLNKYIVDDYFKTLKEIFADLDLMDKPERIYNVNDKCFIFSIADQQSVLAKGAKRVRLAAPEHEQNVTIVSCGTANGSSIPAAILFKAKEIKPDLTDSLPPGTLVLTTSKGSMNIASFCAWLEHFAKYKPAGKCLLIFDGAKLHLDYTIIEVAEKHDIVLLCLPSNTTHELQPMDKLVSRSFEYHWHDQVHQHWGKLPFGQILSIVWTKSVTPANMKAGFLKTGVFPFNPDAISEIAFAPCLVKAEELPAAVPTRNKITSQNPERLNYFIPIDDFTDDSSDEEKTPFMHDPDDDVSDHAQNLNRPYNKSITELLETPEKKASLSKKKTIHSKALVVQNCSVNTNYEASTSS